MNKKVLVLILLFSIPVLLSATGDLFDENVSETLHNLTPTWPGALPDPRKVTSSETEVCIFCHSLHGTGDTPFYLMWNRLKSGQTYTPYTSTSLDASSVNQPKSYSTLCLSCHDGSIEMGRVVNPPGSGGGPALTGEPWTGTAPDLTMPFGDTNTPGEELSGYTRRLGSDLTNDHPVSFVFDSTVIAGDGELTLPSLGGASWSRYLGVKLYPNEFGPPWTFESVQCTSCHNPHSTYEKFLRGNLYQSAGGNIICLSCHKDLPEQWGNSTHAIAPGVLNSNADTVIRSGAAAKGVWEVACLACHDVHTVQGAVRLTRNGVNEPGGVASIENTCFMCHASNSYAVPLVGGDPLTNSAGNQNSDIAPYIRDQFEKDSNLGGSGSAMNLKFDDPAPTHEPVFVKRHQEGVELNSSNPPVNNEYPPGSNTTDKTHIECVDCHNPHQVEKANRLKGLKGVAIDDQTKLVFKGSTDIGCYSFDSGHNNNCDREPYVYEVCLRCHGNSYADLFVDTNGVLFPQETDRRSDPSGGLPANSNFSLKGYSNKRLEFDPLSSQAANSPPNAGNTSLNYNTAYHPVAAAGRNLSTQLFNQLRGAFNLTSSSQLGSLTIQCTDCHNNDDFPDPAVRGPITGLRDGTSYKRSSDKPSNLTAALEDDPAFPQGPHGSNNIRILRGNYNANLSNPPGESCCGPLTEGSPIDQTWFELCFKCHDSTPFLTQASNSWTNFFGMTGFGFGGPWDTNLHYYHIRYTDARCHECHMNIHSNVQATNTIYGDGNNGQLPPDGNTHLINFNPASVTGDQSAYPRWWYDSSLPGFRCNLRCHGVTMVRCAYQYGTIFGPGPNTWIFWPRFCTTSGGA